jgi:release factor glutamine methyltransferase
LTIRTALLQGREILDKQGIAAARLTAEVLLMHAIGCERSWLYAHSDDELRELWWIHYGRYLHERLKGKPTQYITGKQEFYGREFLVTPDVLIPRPETEHSIEAALKFARGAKTIVDIGTGSGAIAVTLALEMGARAIATDISERAVRVAATNAWRLAAQVEFVVSDLGSTLASSSFDLVVSNPPYVPAADKSNLQKEVREYEPEIALFGGVDGLDVYRRLIPEARRLLRPGGVLIMEIGYSEVEPVRELLAQWRDLTFEADLAGIPRVVIAKKPVSDSESN